MKQSYHKYIRAIKESGAKNVKLIHPNQVVVGNWVRLKCQYGCDAYNTRYTCPPDSPTPDYTRQMLKEYTKALFFTYQYAAVKERRERQYIRKTIARLEREMFLDGYHKVFAMGAGPCNLCVRKCDFNKECAHPEIARPSMEACGIDVYATAANADIELKVVRDTKDTPTYCCLILIE